MATTSDPNDPRLTRGVDDAPTEQASVYLVLSEADRLAGFVRPVRTSYVHTGGCGAVTTMPLDIAETYARQPDFYGATYCVGCHQHLPVDQFEWVRGHGEPAVPEEFRRVGS